MNKTMILAVLATAALAACSRPAPSGRRILYYRSPMDPQQTSPVPAKDSMGMDFVPVYAKEQEPAAEKAPGKILYYRSPMDPKQTSPVPAKDSMGMDFVPVYADAAGAASEPGAFEVSPDRLQLIGVKTGAAERRDLVREVRTVGRVAYDPELYRTQEEYLAALSAAGQVAGSSLPDSRVRAESLLASSRLRLKLQGLSDAQIAALGRTGRPDQTLLLSPGKGGEVWLYADAFESDLPLMRKGLAVTATSPSLPGRTFRGVIASIDPVLNPATRAARLRVRLKDPEGDLRPDLYLDAAIRVDLGARLAVPREAVVDTGTRQIVFIDRGQGRLVARRVELGPGGGGWVSVRRGLAEGDRVVTSGNFLIDSESNLQGAVAGFGDGRE